MKKNRLLNAELSYLIAKLGHTESIVIADAGLPIPKNVQRIDLALERGIPSFMEVLDVVLDELEVEGASLAKEIKSANPTLHKAILEKMPVNCDYYLHKTLKSITESTVAVIRTGEASSYANIILHAGVRF